MSEADAKKAKRVEPPDAAQRQAIVTDLDSTILVEAAAGTGKTTSMVMRMVELLRSGKCANIADLAAVTFTRKAAAELRARFQATLETEAAAACGPEGERLIEARAFIDQCFIGTIHSFCARLLRERPVEAGVDLAFRELEPEEDNRLRKRAWDEYSAGLIAHDPDGILEELRRLAMTVSELDRSFMRFADFPDVDAWPVPEASRDLPPLKPVAEAVKAYARHMTAGGPYPDDPRAPSGGRRLLEEYVRLPWLVRRGDMLDPPTLIDVLEQFDRDAPSVSAELKKEGWSDFAKEEQARWKAFRAEVAGPFMRAVMELRYRVVMKALAEALVIYDRLRSGLGVLNFQDLLMRSADLLRDKPHIRRYFSRRFTHLLVDEFQDTDPIQAQVMLFLTADDPNEGDWKKCVPRRGSLFVVGDPKQSIYRFRRADIVTYNDVKSIIEANGRVLELSANFRAIGCLIDWTNEAFSREFGDEATTTSPAYVALQKGRSEPPESELSGVRALLVPAALCKGNAGADGLDYEADLIARFIAGAIERGVTITRPGEDSPSQVTPADFMVIAYNKSALSSYARKLQQYGVRHQVSGGTALSETPELQLLHACLDAVVQPDNPVALVGALRNELFGLSDAALYSFKAAGGRFDYNTEVPSAIDPGQVEAFADAFGRLREYSRWLQKMPPVAAVERMVAHLGLVALAASRDGGDVQAGSVAKALELMRFAQRDLPTAADLVDFLGQIIDGSGSDSFDGISALPDTGSTVRIMNLHKAKGLQAPVVFLANHKTAMGGAIDAYIDRSDESDVLGYMGIYRETTFNPVLRATPECWDDVTEIECAFEEAERTRLRYVAATRAESMLVVTRQSNGKGRSIWNELGPYVDGEPELDDPVQVKGRKAPESSVTQGEVASASAAIEARLIDAGRATYAVRAAKELALSGDEASLSTAPIDAGGVSFAEIDTHVMTRLPEGEHGVEWGGAVHQVLEFAMKKGDADLETFAGAALEEAGIGRARLGDLVDTVRAVMAADIWRRARGAKCCLSEVSFETVLMGLSKEAGAPEQTLVRGSIDLAFQEEDGWVIVDYKTDAVKEASQLEELALKYAPQIRIYARAFEQCTGQKPRQTALYFIRNDALIDVK